MPVYTITAPNGKTYRIEGPAGATQDQVVAEILRRDPSAGQAPSTERTWAETATDIGAGLTTGAGRLAQLPGQLYGLATGDFSPTGTLGVGKRIEAAGQGMKSEGLKARESQRSAAVQAAAETGQVEAFKTAFMETLKDPALAASFVAEQLPNLAAIIATGGTAAAVTAGRVSAAALAKGASQKAAARLAAQAATRVGAPAAVGAGAALQGADIGAGTYDAVVERLKSQGMPQEQAAEEAINSARAAGASAATISFLVNRYFPGGMALERALLGKKTGLGMLGGAAAGALREIPTEVIEETAGGRLLQNIALQGVDPTQSLAEGLGEAGGMAAAGALLVGGGAGAIAGRGTRKEPGLSPEAAADMEAQRRIEAEREAARAARSAQATADEALLASDNYAELVRGREVLRQTPDTPGAKELLKALDQRIQEVLAADVAQQQAAAAQTARDAQLASQSAFAVTDPQQMEMGGMGEPGVLPPAVSSEAQAWARTPAGQDFLGALRQLPADTIEASRGDTRLLPRAKDKASAAKRELFSALYPQAPVAPTQKQMEAAGQRPLPLTVTPEGQPTTERPPLSPQREFGGFGMAGTLPQAPVAPEPTPPTQKQLEAAGQQRLPLRRTPAGQPTTSLFQEPIVEPTAPAAPVEDGIPEPTIRQKPVVPIPEALEATGTDAAKAWARKPYGQKFIAKMQQIDPNSIEDARGALAKGSDPASTAKREIFNAIYPDSVAQPAPRDDVRPEQEVVGEPAEPSVGVPVPSGPDQAGAQLTEPSDGAGVGAVQRPAGTEPVVEGAAPAAVTAEQLIGNVETDKTEEGMLEAINQLAAAWTDPNRTDKEVIADYVAANVADTNFTAEFNKATAAIRRRGNTYRTSEPQAAPAQPISAAELNNTVSQITKSLDLPDGAGITVLDSITQVDPSQRAGSRAGMVTETGDIYLFRDGIAGGLEGQKTVFHELFHKGLRNLLPPAEYYRTMLQLYRQSAQVRELTDAWLADPQNQADVAALQPDQQRAVAVDEVLAGMAEQRKLPGTIRQIGNWMANLAARFGLPKLARSLRTMGMKPLEIFIDDALRAAGPAPQTVATRYSTAPTPAERAAQAMQTVEELGNALPPDPTVVQSIKAMYQSTVQNPQAIFQSAATARDSIFQKFGRGFWSTDFTAQHEIRKHVIRANMTAPQVTDMLLRSTTAQAQHSDAMGIRVAMDGAAKYDPATYTWRSVKSKANVETLSASFAKIASKYKRTEQDVERMWHSATEARRLNDVLRTNALLDAEAAQFEADGDTQKAQAALDRQIRRHRTPEQIAKGMALFDTIPELNDANDVWDTLRGNIIDVLVEGGLYSQQEAETMFDNVAYVPFTRDAQLEEGKGPKEYMSGMLARRTPKFKGTDNPENTVHDIFDNIVRFVQYSVETSIRNRKAMDLASATTELGITAEVKALTRDRPGVTIYREGKPVYVVENVPGVLEAFRGVEGVAIPALRWFSAPADWLRKSVVLFPLFPVLQVPQDSFAAMFSSGLKPQFALTIPVRAVKEFIKTLAGTSKIHEELKRTGVVGRKDVSAAVRRNDIEIAAHLKKSPGLWAPVSKVLHHISMASDNAVRQAVYEAAISQGLSRAEALNKAFETINFRYRGTSKLMAMGAQLIPFFNAYQAATYVTYKTITGTNISKATRAEARDTLRNTALVVMAMSMLYAMLLGGDEDYEDMADIKRNRLLVIPGTGTGIPLRPDLFLLPKVTGEHAYRMLTEMGTSDAAKFREAVTESIKNTFLSPTVVPQVVKPWVEVMANYDPFTERPLVGTYEKQQLLASMQTNDRTSELAKALAAASGDDNFSPIAVEHIIRGMFGSVGGVLLYASNQMMTPASGAPRAELSLRDALATFPGLGSVVGKDIEGGAAADFYQLREVTRKAKTTLDRVEERMPQLLDKYLDNPRFMARVELADEVEYISKRLAKLREYKIAVQSATDMTPQEKQRELREIAESQQEWLKSAPMREWRARAQLR